MQPSHCQVCWYRAYELPIYGALREPIPSSDSGLAETGNNMSISLHLFQVLIVCRNKPSISCESSDCSSSSHLPAGRRITCEEFRCGQPLSRWGRQLCLGLCLEPGERLLQNESFQLSPHLPVHSANICRGSAVHWVTRRSATGGAMTVTVGHALLQVSAAQRMHVPRELRGISTNDSFYG